MGIVLEKSSSSLYLKLLLVRAVVFKRVVSKTHLYSYLCKIASIASCYLITLYTDTFRSLEGF